MFRTAAEIVRFNILSAGAEEDSEVVTSLFLHPSYLLTVKHLSGLEELQVLVVCYHLDLVVCTFQKISPSLETVYNCKQFFVCSVVVDFSLGEFLRVECHWVCSSFIFL